MTRSRLTLPLLAALLLAACTSTVSTPSSDPEATATPEASVEPSLAPSEEPAASEAGSVAPSETPVETPPPFGGTFEIAAHPEADTLFLDRDSCQNLRDGYQLEFPDAWYTNTEYRNFAPCVWFSPTNYATDGDSVPPEIAITVEWIPGDVGRTDADSLSTVEGEVGGQAATRTEWDDDTYWYVVQLGPTLEEGPNLLFATSAAMGGDYELNKAVLDRMLTTIEFIGSTQ
jgi:hypothetical protein